VSDTPQKPAPEASQGKPPVSEAQGTTDNQVRAENQNTDSQPLKAQKEEQEPADKVEDGPDEGSKKKVEGESEDFWLRARQEPLARFTFWLTICTGVLAVATVVLAVATGVLAYYAREQAADMTKVIAAFELFRASAEKAAGALQKGAEATERVAEINQSMVEADKASQERIDAERRVQKRALVSVSSADVQSFDTWTANAISARVQTRNTGPEQAERVRIFAELTVERPSSTPCRTTREVADGISIAANGGDHTFLVRARRTISQDEKQRVIAGALAIFVYGRINYWDVQGVARYKHFRLAYRGDGAPVRDGSLRMSHTQGCGDGN
jgi:hypothetical protein